MGLFSSVSANVTGLVFKTVEGLVTERALVRTRKVLAWLLLGLLLLRPPWRYAAKSLPTLGE